MQPLLCSSPAGSLFGNSANKGVFVTTSTFNAPAIDFVRHLPQRMILIDHGVDVGVARTVEVKCVDEAFLPRRIVGGACGHPAGSDECRRWNALARPATAIFAGRQRNENSAEFGDQRQNIRTIALAGIPWRCGVFGRARERVMGYHSACRSYLNHRSVAVPHAARQPAPGARVRRPPCATAGAACTAV